MAKKPKKPKKPKSGTSFQGKWNGNPASDYRIKRT